MKLARGDLVGVVATGFAVRRADLRHGVAALRGMGFEIRLGRHVLDRDGYLAGNDDDRLADLLSMVDDPDVRAIWFARGGYGTARILDRIPWRRLRSRPKLWIGYSDLTALFAAIDRRLGDRCLYGPVVTEMGAPAGFHARSLRAGLAGRPFELSVRAGQVQVAGRARGRLAGGNLTVLAHALGTRHRPDLRGRVLFLEDVGEPLYRIDRALTQLRQSGGLAGVAGVLLGDFGIVPRRRFPPDRELGAVLDEAFGSLGVPVVRGIPAGHVPAKRTLPLGDLVRIDTGARRIRFGS